VERPALLRASIVKRCAIYTRKSSDEGLEQGFNSLDAQREACEAYVLSQAGEGWTALPTPYDDGGFSGGSMERPGLQKLLTDIRAGRIDVVVVYKIDRLTRALADFARIVETLDAHEVSFVSVTQAFNTTNSMGRLTLNVMLSFAQFEREVTGERIRDKIAASKAKGMWMGGLSPLGYDLPVGGSRALVVNFDEAKTVRNLFRRYLELGSVYKLIDELDRQGVRSKLRVTAKGHALGGTPFSRGAMFHLLQNRVYVGDIVHKGERFDGQHEGIVDPSLFEEVQKMLAAHRRTRTTRQRTTSPLLGKLFDAAGRRMSPTYSRGARGSVYRYYVSSSAAGQRLDRVSARTIEAVLLSRLTRLLPDVADPLDAIAKVQLADGEIIVTLAATFSRTIKGQLEPDEQVGPNGTDDKLVDLYLPASLGSRNVRATIRPTSTPAGRRDPVLIKALRTAHAMIELTRSGAPIIEAVPGPRYQRRLLRLAFLSPDIQRAILAGRQPAGLRLEDLVRNPMPTDWKEQQRWIERLAR
jgi:site-specific DNA recombinase